jgi:hypothetical protein
MGFIDLLATIRYGLKKATDATLNKPGDGFWNGQSGSFALPEQTLGGAALLRCLWDSSLDGQKGFCHCSARQR